MTYKTSFSVKTDSLNSFLDTSQQFGPVSQNFSKLPGSRNGAGKCEIGCIYFKIFVFTEFSRKTLNIERFTMDTKFHKFINVLKDAKPESFSVKHIKVHDNNKSHTKASRFHEDLKQIREHSQLLT